MLSIVVYTYTFNKTVKKGEEKYSPVMCENVVLVRLTSSVMRTTQTETSRQRR